MMHNVWFGSVFTDTSGSLLVTKHLHYKKLCSRWMLNKVDKTKYMGAALEFLSHFVGEGNNFWKGLSLVMKQVFTMWHQKADNNHCILVAQKQIQKNIFCKKNHVYHFLKRWGILVVEFMAQDTTVNAESYCETVKKLWWVIQNERHGLLSSGIVLLHDKAQPHSAYMK